MEKLTIEQIIDDFASEVEPTLFKGNRRGNKDYFRVKALLYARQAEREGRKPRRRVTETWAVKILNEFAPGRYKRDVYYSINR
jgi:hypothetical protein